MENVTVGYLAGIIDGEGCIYVNRRKASGRRLTPGYGVKVVVSITSRELVAWFKVNARLTSIHEKHPPGNRKTTWVCTWNNSAAEWLLSLIAPHLVIKPKQAKLAVQLLAHLRTARLRPGKTTSLKTVEYRERIKAEIAKLNRRGRPTE